MSTPSRGPSSGKASSARPRQLTMAAGFVIGGSVFLMLRVFDTLTNLNSVEMRDEIAQMLSSPTGEGLGISMSQALTVMKVGLMVAAACAAAAAVLGVYVLQRNGWARLALSILAVPILLTAPLTGGLIGALVVAATAMLWSGPARDWFAGRPIRQLQVPGRHDKAAKPGPWETTMPRDSDRLRQPDHTPPPVQDTATPSDKPSDRPSDQEAPQDRPTPPASELTTSGTSTAPGASTGFGVRPASADDRPQESSWPPPAVNPAGVTWGADPRTVPAPVKIACILTWVFSGVVALLYAGVLVALIAMQDQIVEYVVDTPEWQRSNLQEGILVPVLWLGCLMFLAWSLGACALAWFTWRRHNWARWLLAISAAGAFVAGMFAFPVGLLHQLAAVLTVVGLFLTTSRTWFEQDAWSNSWQGSPSGAPGPPQGPPTGHPGAQSPGSYPSGPSADRPPQDGPPQDGPPQDGPPQDGPPQDGPPGGKPPVW